MREIDHTGMPIWEHLEVLRWMFIRILIAWGIGVIACFLFIPYLFDHVIMAPAQSDFFLYRFLGQLSSYTSLMPGFLEKPLQVDVINIKLASQSMKYGNSFVRHFTTTNVQKCVGLLYLVQ